jgi:hypothetical protein
MFQQFFGPPSALGLPERGGAISGQEPPRRVQQGVSRHREEPHTHRTTPRRSQSNEMVCQGKPLLSFLSFFSVEQSMAEETEVEAKEKLSLCLTN